ncbi:hypothetical protein PsorP6_015673 [Peronosclerospora sorghi]|uniref:Uncharacterized protein n=1 Tax=Peronosclerospora sorghi TaxID=230839 RepID=A0ACC0WMN5_9STRA|nr:hypothetical protein PsorP6_015673 [Peronosclerospora sorghi]
MEVVARPQNVVTQYTDVLGRPAMPPYWALGYQVNQSGGKSVDDAMKVVTKLSTAGIPMDAYWQDFKLIVDE